MVVLKLISKPPAGRRGLCVLLLTGNDENAVSQIYIEAKGIMMVTANLANFQIQFSPYPKVRTFSFTEFSFHLISINSF
jgi:hypothetical protein